MAAADLKGTKRKGAPDSAPKPKKQKKVDSTAAANKKSTKALKAAVDPVDSLSTKVKSSRKRAEDFFSDDDAQTKEKRSKKKAKATVTIAEETIAETPKEKAKKEKKGKRSEKPDVAVAAVEATVVDEEPANTEVKKVKKGKNKSKQHKDMPEETSEALVLAGDAEEEDLDDQTAALLAGFESDRDESDLEKEDEDFDEAALENVPKLSKKQQKALEKATRDSEPGVVYLGRIPHGFFEPQMKKYFAQFGQITRLRLSRNKKTGASKHFAFIEFAHGDVADIVAQTMNNYLMFGHILQCRVVPAEQVHAELFKGANQRFKVDPRNKKTGTAMKRGAERAVWENRVRNENKKRISAAKALKEEFGYDFKAPAVKPASTVAQKVTAVEDGVPEQSLIEAPAGEVTDVVQVTESKPNQLTVTEVVTVKKGKKGTKRSQEVGPKANEVVEEEPLPAIKSKKDKKRQSDVVADAIEEPLTDATPTKSKKAKKDGAKSKKAKKA